MGKNRVWHISDTKVVLSHLKVLTVNLAICATSLLKRLLRISVLFMMDARYTSLLIEVLSEAVSSMKLSQNKRKWFSLSFLEEIQLKTWEKC